MRGGEDLSVIFHTPSVLPREKDGIMSYITMIRADHPSALGKRFKLDENGVLRKTAVASISAGKAVAV